MVGHGCHVWTSRLGARRQSRRGQSLPTRALLTYRDSSDTIGHHGAHLERTSLNLEDFCRSWRLPVPKRKKPPLVAGVSDGAPRRSRTPNLRIRSPTLYPIELWAQKLNGAETEGVEPSEELLTPHSISNRAPSATRSRLQKMNSENNSGGGGGIRTHGPRGTAVFKTAAFDHSATPPGEARRV